MLSQMNKRKAGDSPTKESSGPSAAKRARVDNKTTPLATTTTTDDAEVKKQEEKNEGIASRIPAKNNWPQSGRCCYLCSKTLVERDKAKKGNAVAVGVVVFWPVQNGSSLGFAMCSSCESVPRLRELALWHFMDARAGFVRVRTSWDNHSAVFVQRANGKLVEAKFTGAGFDSDSPRYMNFGGRTATPRLHLTYTDEGQVLGKYVTIASLRTTNPLLPPFRFCLLNGLSLLEVFARAPFESWSAEPSNKSLVRSFAIASIYYDSQLEAKLDAANAAKEEEESSSSSSSSSSSATQETDYSTQPVGPEANASQAMDLALYDTEDSK